MPFQVSRVGGWHLPLSLEGAASAHLCSQDGRGDSLPPPELPYVVPCLLGALTGKEGFMVVLTLSSCASQ